MANRYLVPLKYLANLNFEFKVEMKFITVTKAYPIGVLLSMKAKSSAATDALYSKTDTVLCFC